MDCEQCGKEAIPDQNLCQECLDAATESSFDAELTKEDQKRKACRKYSEFAGFWLRLFAYLADATAINVIGILLLIAVPAPVISLMDIFGSFISEMNIHSFPVLSSLGLVVTMIPTLLCVLILRLLYNTILEGSVKQATPGKILFKIVVVSTSGKRISTGRALIRNLARICFVFLPIGFAVLGILASLIDASGIAGFLSGLAFLSFILGYSGQYILTAFTPRKQALHDYIGETYVVRKERLRFSQYAWRAMLALFMYLLVLSLFSSGQNQKGPHQAQRSLPQQSLFLALS